MSETVEASSIKWVRILPATSGLAGVLALIFVMQVFTSEDLEAWNLEIPAWDLVRQGGQDLVLAHLNGEWWRYFTAALLHANLLHILLNGGVLIYSGQYVERRLGGYSLLGILAAGAVGGAVVSSALLDPDVVSVGASGGIMALVAVAAAMAYLVDEDEEQKTHRGRVLLNVLIASLIPHSSGVDYGAHFGGALVGGVIVLCLILGRDPEPDSAEPRRRHVFLAIALTYAAVSMYGGYVMLSAPAAMLDPDAGLARAVAALDAQQPAEAVREARAALYAVRTSPARGSLRRMDFPDKVEAVLKLADAQMRPGRQHTSDDALIRLCVVPLDKPMKQRLVDAGLCHR